MGSGGEACSVRRALWWVGVRRVGHEEWGQWWPYCVAAFILHAGIVIYKYNSEISLKLALHICFIYNYLHKNAF
jgi:hypothetical protein